jgi:hypothetical protein
LFYIAQRGSENACRLQEPLLFSCSLVFDSTLFLRATIMQAVAMMIHPPAASAAAFPLSTAPSTAVPMFSPIRFMDEIGSSFCEPVEVCGRRQAYLREKLRRGEQSVRIFRI